MNEENAMTDLTEFLLARIAVAEEVVRDYRQVWDEDESSPWHPYTFEKEGPYLSIDPNFVRAECAAIRRIVERATSYVARKTTGDRVTDAAAGVGWSVYESVLRDLALPYAQHPDYRDEWRP